MLKGKDLLLIVGLVVIAGMALYSKTNSPTIEEGFWGMIPNRTVKVVQSVNNPRNGAQMALQPNSFLGNLPDSQFIKTPSFQANLAPRFSNVSYGAHIKYNMPDYQHQAVPCNPLTFGNMTNENYDGTTENYNTSCGSGACSDQGCSVSCGKGGVSVPYTGGDDPVQPGYASGNYNDMLNSAYDESGAQESHGALPLGSMNTVDADGNVGQAFVYQNYIYANQRSRLRGLGDNIRGDLAVTPLRGSWFVPSACASPNINLNAGALNVMGGISNTQGQSVADLVYQSSGNAVTALGGVDMSRISGTPEYQTGYNSIYNDVQVKAMP